MSRRSLTLLIASVGTAVAIAVSVLVPVPYVILGPGPTLNTLGKASSGQPLITIVGHATYPTTGHLNLVTVGYQGGPGVTINIFSALSYSAHPSAEAELRRVAEVIAEKFPVLGIAAVHRVGDLEIGDLAVVVAVACPHRAEAFDACRALIDLLKASVPIWKHQRFDDGSAEWVGTP